MGLLRATSLFIGGPLTISVYQGCNLKDSLKKEKKSNKLNCSHLKLEGKEYNLVIEHFPSMLEALSLIPSTRKAK
jgi:hypothetical protein